MKDIGCKLKNIMLLLSAWDSQKPTRQQYFCITGLGWEVQQKDIPAQMPDLP